jgi:hypothetical protein
MFGMTPLFEAVRSLVPCPRFNPRRPGSSIRNLRNKEYWHRSPVVLLLLSALFMGVMIAAETAQAYSISGIITNSTSTAGRVFLSLDIQGGGTTGLGLSVPVDASSSAPFSIRGAFGTSNYVIHAFLDAADTGVQHASSPAGSSGTISFNNSDMTGIDFSVSTPAPVGLTSNIPDPTVSATTDAVAINFNSGQMMSNGSYVPDSLNIYWGYASDSLNNMNNVPVDGRGDVVFLTGLSGGTFYVKMVPVVGGSEDTAHASGVVSVPLSTPAGNSTLTGNVISTGIVKSSNPPLYVAAVGDNGFYITYVSNPADTQPYTITGVVEGTYQIYAILDMDNNHFINIGDIQNTNRQAPAVAADGTNPIAAPDVVLTAQSASVTSGTVHVRSAGGDSYTLNVKIQNGTKLPVNAAITGGPQISSSVPIDLAWVSSWGEMSFMNLVPARPSVGDLYTVHIEYSDATSENLSLPVTAVLDSFAVPIYPAGNTAPDGVTPLFSWRAAGGTPGYFDYKIWVQDAGHSNIWYKDNPMPANQISVSYNNDGNSSLNQLESGVNYTWTIAVRDAFGNEAWYETSFTPQSSGPSVAGFNPATGTGKIASPPTPGTTVVISGTGFSEDNTNVYFGGVQVPSTDFTIDSSTQITAQVPSAAPVGPITVNVNGTASSSGIFTPTVNFSGMVRDSAGGNLSGVTVSTSGLAPFYPEVSTSTDSSGNYSLTGPAGMPFTLHFSKATFHDVYTARMASAQNNTSPSPYVLFTDADLASKSGITPSPGKGLIGTRVVNPDNGNNVSGATVTATSKFHGQNYYTVAYTDPGNPSGGIVSGPGTSTYSDGKFYVLNVDEGDYVAVLASRSGWGFQARTYITHAGAISETHVRGTPLPVVTPNPAAGTYTSAQSVELTAGNGTACASGCSIFYTTNGNDPTLGGALSYTGSGIPINSTTTLNFYAKNGDNISGNVVTANYVIAILPAVTTAAISNKTSTSATGGGDITSDGGSEITARGVCWSTSPDPSLIDSCTNDGTGIGIFSSSITGSITGLTSGQEYHVRAYATNEVGTAYGADVTFTTGNMKGDFNGDGKTDILWRNTSSGQNAVWFLDGATVTGFAVLDSMTDQTWTIVGTGDFNGDGKTDILWRNTSSGQNAVWYLDGATVTGFAVLDSMPDQTWQIVGR